MQGEGTEPVSMGGGNLARGQHLRAVTGWSLGEARLSWASSHAELSIK